MRWKKKSERKRERKKAREQGRKGAREQGRRESGEKRRGERRGERERRGEEREEMREEREERWFLRNQGIQTVTLSWTNLDNDVTESYLVGYSGLIGLTSRTQFVNCPRTSAQLPFVMKSTSSVC